MTIYAVGGESEIFGSGARWETSGFDADYARISNLVAKYESIETGIESPFGGDSTSGWWFRVRLSTVEFDEYLGSDLLEAFDSSGGRVFALRANGGALVEVSVVSSTGNEASQLISSSATGNYFIDVHCYTDTGDTVLEFYKAEALLASVTATGANPPLGAIAFRGSGDGNFGRKAYYSEFIAADEDTRGMRVKTVVPTGDDPTHNWSGSFADIDQYDDDSADGISGKDGETALFTHANDLSLNNVHAFVIAGRVAAVSSDGAQGLIRINDANYETPFLHDLTRGERAHFAVFSTNPATGASFTAAELNALSFGIKAGAPA